MKRATFEIKQSPTGNYYFTFKGLNGDTQTISRSFPNRIELEKCLSGVREAAPLADVIEDFDQYGKLPVFQIQRQADGFVFSLLGFKREIVFSSISYLDVKQCEQAIGILKDEASNAAILDLTID